jgi:hypothetical protein
MGWPSYAENLVLASADGGAALLIYGDCQATMKVADGETVVLDEQTHYPFEQDVALTVGGLKKNKAVSFPVYLRIPTWTQGAHVTVNGKTVKGEVRTGLLRLEREWKNGDQVKVHFPMRLTMRRWALNQNSVTVDYGPLTMSLLIKERYEKKDSKTTAIGDSHWQATADAEQWPSYEIYPESPWNYGLLPCLESMAVEWSDWPQNDYPFNLQDVPLRVKARGARIPSWGQDETGLCQILPDGDAPRGELEDITLVPMGAARLRISAFPPVEKR